MNGDYTILLIDKIDFDTYCDEWISRPFHEGTMFGSGNVDENVTDPLYKDTSTSIRQLLTEGLKSLTTRALFVLLCLITWVFPIFSRSEKYNTFSKEGRRRY